MLCSMWYCHKYYIYIYVCSAASGLTECMEEGQIANNLLVFVSALIPKALGSLLTSLVMELSKPDQVGLPPKDPFPLLYVHIYVGR